MAPKRAKLRKREIAFALAMGGIGAFGTAVFLLDGNGGDSPAPVAAAAPEQQSHELEPFEEISSVGPQDVVIVTGDSFSVRSEGSPAAIARLEAVVDDDTLVIRPKGNFASFDWDSVSGVKFYVTTPRLDSLSLAGSGSVRIDRIDGGSFEASIAGPGELEIAAMDVAEADFTIAGSGRLVAAGSAGETELSVLGSGSVDAGGLTSDSASISMAGSGKASLTVTDEARVSIMGSGDVNVAGPGQCRVSRMGSGQAHCAGGEIGD